MLLAAVRVMRDASGRIYPWKGKPSVSGRHLSNRYSGVLRLNLTAGFRAAASVSNTWLLSPSGATERLDFALQ